MKILCFDSAEALAKGDMETVFKNQKIHADNREKALTALGIDPDFQYTKLY